MKIAGRANFSFSPDFKALLTGLAQKGYSHFIIDLSECVLMDSTFLGVLAGFGIKLNQTATPDQRGIELLNANARVTELLENLGALHLFKITTGALPLPDGIPDQRARIRQPDPRGNHPHQSRSAPDAHGGESGKCCPVQGRDPVSGRGFEDVEKGK